MVSYLSVTSNIRASQEYLNSMFKEFLLSPSILSGDAFDFVLSVFIGVRLNSIEPSLTWMPPSDTSVLLILDTLNGFCIGP